MYNAPTKAKYHYRLIGGDRKPAYLVEVWQGDNTYSEPLRIDFYSADSEGEAQFQTKSVENLEHNVKIMKAIWRAAATANNREFADWHRLTMEDLQKALAHLKAVQIAYDSRISRYVTRETMADCSLSRWMDVAIPRTGWGWLGPVCGVQCDCSRCNDLEAIVRWKAATRNA